MKKGNETNGVTKSENSQKLTHEAVEKVEKGPSNIEMYKTQDQNDESVSLGLKSGQKDMRAFCQDWEIKWGEASKK